ncbi:hypothetical protein V496_04294 [Pseudogymnoascus sp. VKM F-4515 (FW-2607)]|nr:hypothetical protein V496_04294 [Pseudogymnoascus sp. VKM F-4515 (FW-2607)]KFZ00388.1 hypothetical protein V498_00107 [Pseudogymnoascus sp. VKM F-4517 (FW-2822)]
MCVTEIFVDSYPDGAEVEFHRVKLCQHGYPEDPCDLHVVKEQPIRYIQYGEPTSEFIISQMRSTPRSSAPAPMVEVIEERPTRSRQKRRPLSNLFMGALFPSSTRRNRKSSRSKSRERVVIINAPPSPARPRTPPPTASPIYYDPRVFMPPMSPGYDSNEAAYIVEVSPSRGRQRPIIHETSRRPRSASIEFRYTSPRRQRSPSQHRRDERRRRQRQEERERRERDQREAKLVAEIKEERERRRRLEFLTLQDAEINARPVRFPSPAPRLRSILRPVADQTRRWTNVIDDLGLSTRGERVIAEAIAERERNESRERLLRERLEAEEAEEAQKERLKRRFTVSEGFGPRGRRHRVVYDDGTYRWAD